MAHILFAIPRFHPNLWFAVRALRQAGHQVTLLTNVAGSNEEHSFATPIVLGRHPDQSAVNAVFDEARPDLVIIRNAFDLSQRAARAARRRGLPALLYNLHPLTQRTRLQRRIELAWRGLPGRRITPVRGLDRTAPTDPQATYLPWPVAALPTAPKVPEADGKLRLLCVGKLGSERKNQHLLVQTIEEAGLTDRLHLTLIGTLHGRTTQSRDAHHTRLARLADKDWITLQADIALSDMPAFHAAHDACILPSFDEPLGFAPLEAMAYGTIPLISADSGSAGYLTSGKDGFVTDMRQPGQLAGQLGQLISDPALRQRLSHGARHTVETELSETRFLERFDALLSRIAL